VATVGGIPPPTVDFRDYDTRLAAYAVVRDDRDRILLALWNEVEQPEWTLPGGGVEFDETPAEGAMRELLEESGYEVELLEVLGVDTHAIPADERIDPPGRPMKSVRVVFEARIVGGGCGTRSTAPPTRRGGFRSRRCRHSTACLWSTPPSRWPPGPVRAELPGLVPNRRGVHSDHAVRDQSTTPV